MDPNVGNSITLLTFVDPLRTVPVMIVPVPLMGKQRSMEKLNSVAEEWLLRYVGGRIADWIRVISWDMFVVGRADWSAAILCFMLGLHLTHSKSYLRNANIVP